MLLCIMGKMWKNMNRQGITAGIFLLFAGINITIAFLTRFEYLSGINNITEDLEYLYDNRFILQINSFLWLGASILMVFASASLLSSMSVYKIIPAYLTGFFFLLASFMFFMTSIKGLGIIELISYQQAKVIDPADNMYFNASIISLSKERDNFIKMSAAIIGLGIFSTGLFSFRTRKIPLFHGILCTLTGFALPVIVLFFPDSPLLNFTLISALIAFILVSILLTFHGFAKKKKAKSSP